MPKLGLGGRLCRQGGGREKKIKDKKKDKNKGVPGAGAAASKRSSWVSWSSGQAGAGVNIVVIIAGVVVGVVNGGL